MYEIAAVRLGRYMLDLQFGHTEYMVLSSHVCGVVRKGVALWPSN